MEIIRVGVIGVGNIGTMHANNIYNNQIQGMELAAICDVNPLRLEACRERFSGVQQYSDYASLLQCSSIDAVIIAVPHRLHARIAMDALHAGLHVLLEKPMDVTVSEAKKLIDVSKKTNKIFALMLNQRTNPLFQKAYEIVHNGQLGELKRSVWIITNWYRTQHYYDSGSWRATWNGEGGGVLLNQAPHNLDLWQWICGMPESIRAFCNVARFHNIEVEDDATIYAKYKNGATGVFITTTGEYPGTNRLEISGDRGKIVLEQGCLKWWKLKQSEREVCFESTKSAPVIDFDYQEMVDSDEGAGHIGILQNFANAILFGETLLSPGEDGIYELTISNAAYLSEWTGNAEICIPFDMAQFDALLEERRLCGDTEKINRQIATDESDDRSRWQVRW